MCILTVPENAEKLNIYLCIECPACYFFKTEIPCSFYLHILQWIVLLKWEMEKILLIQNYWKLTNQTICYKEPSIKLIYWGYILFKVLVACFLFYLFPGILVKLQSEMWHIKKNFNWRVFLCMCQITFTGLNNNLYTSLYQ